MDGEEIAPEGETARGILKVAALKGRERAACSDNDAMLESGREKRNFMKFGQDCILMGARASKIVNMLFIFCFVKVSKIIRMRQSDDKLISRIFTSLLPTACSITSYLALFSLVSLCERPPPPLPSRPYPSIPWALKPRRHHHKPPLLACPAARVT